MADTPRPQRRLTLAVVVLAGGWAGLTLALQRLLPADADMTQLAIVFATVVPVCVVLQLIGGRLLSKVAESHDAAVASEQRALESLAKAEADLEARLDAERRIRFLEQVVEQSRDAILVTDDSGVAEPGPALIYANPAFYALTGYSETDAIGSRPLQKAATATPEAMARLLESLDRREPAEAELLVPRRDGTQLWADVSVAPLFADDGELTNYVAMVRDVSERRELTAQLFHSQKMEAVGRLAGSIAHDFNNLLTAIRGFEELAERSVAEGRAPTVELREIREAADRAARLTDQLLGFSRPQADAVERSCDLAAVVRSAETMLGRLAGETVGLDVDLVGLEGHVALGATEVEQILVNLVVNARDAMDGDGGLVRIEVSPTEAGHSPAVGLDVGPYACLRVADDGVGMDSEVKARAFEPFFTTKSAGKGTGLGLATVYAVVEHARGRVQVDSRPGQGTTFTIWLPLVAAPIGSDPETTALRPASGRSETVLVVEDDDAVRTLLHTLLSRRGYRVLDAPSGEAAMALAYEADSIDILVSDVAMPGISGPELAEQMREEWPDLKVLLVSGYSADRIDAEMRDMDFLAKPFSADQLAERLRDLIERAPTAPSPI